MSAIRGAALVGGASHAPTQLLEVERRPPLASGLPQLDAIVAGIEPGTVWAVVGPRGAGVSELALTYALHAVVREQRPTLIVNGHLGATTLAARLAALHGSLTGRDGDELPDAQLAERLSELSAGQLSVASWMRVPIRLPSGDWDWAADPLVSRDLVVYDTLDEVLDARVAVTGEQRIATLRDLRAAARRSLAGVLVTARLAPVEAGGGGARTAWRRHAMYEAIQDAADVIMTVVDGGYGDISVLIESRAGRGGLVGLNRDGPAGLLHPAGRHHRLAEL